MPSTQKQLATAKAVRESRGAAARLAGMKLRAGINPPQAARGKFPYPGRSCVEWVELSGGQIIDRQMTMIEHRRAAKRGSKKLKDAILMMAAKRLAA